MRYTIDESVIDRMFALHSAIHGGDRAKVRELLESDPPPGIERTEQLDLLEAKEGE